MRTMRKVPFIILLSGILTWSPGAADEPTRHHHPAHPKEKAQGPVRITDEELHEHGGTPPGWEFSVPLGDPEAGRGVFIKFECYSCHDVGGEKFPVSDTERRPGPDLTGVGEEHPAEYFAEAILNPNAVIVTGPGFTGKDDLSIMPSYADILSLQEWVDLVAYLTSLTSDHDHAEDAH